MTERIELSPLPKGEEAQPGSSYQAVGEPNQLRKPRQIRGTADQGVTGHLQTKKRLRIRASRERQGLKYLTAKRRSSALDLGTAAVVGEKPLNWKARAAIGMELGIHFVKRGIARATRFNQFEWLPPP